MPTGATPISVGLQGSKGLAGLLCADGFGEHLEGCGFLVDH